MSTQIKKNGNWVTVAGGTRMWVGTKAALQAALDAGELVDGTAVMVTDDYDEDTVRKGNFVIGWSSDTSIHYVKQNVTFATPMPDADYEVNFTYTDVSNWAELMNIKVCEKTVNGFNILCSYTDYKYNGTISYTAFKVN